jgi:CRP/FNR family cyclic AMP-dependent transcriptional regulator
MPDMEELLVAHPFVAGLEPEQVQLVRGCARGLRSFEADEVIFRAGGMANCCYLICHGTIAIEVHSPGHGARVVQTVGKGELLGWSWMFEPYRWLFDARAMTATEVIELDGKALRECAAADTSMGFHVMSRVAVLLAGRLQATQLQLLDLYVDRP